MSVDRGGWGEMKGKVKQRWARLSQDEIEGIGGHRDQLVGKVQERYGIARDEAERQVDAFFDQCSC